MLLPIDRPNADRLECQPLVPVLSLAKSILPDDKCTGKTRPCHKGRTVIDWLKLDDLVYLGCFGKCFGPEIFIGPGFFT